MNAARLAKKIYAYNKRGNYKKENLKVTMSHADGTVLPVTVIALTVDVGQYVEYEMTLPNVPLTNIQFYWEERIAQTNRAYRYQLVPGDGISMWNAAYVLWDAVMFSDQGKKTIYDGSIGGYGVETTILELINGAKTSSQ